MMKFCCFMFVLLLCSIAQAHGQFVQAEGSAVITKDGVGKARQLAIQDAMRQAAVQARARVQTNSQIAQPVQLVQIINERCIGKRHSHLVRRSAHSGNVFDADDFASGPSDGDDGF